MYSILRKLLCYPIGITVLVKNTKDKNKLNNMKLSNKEIKILKNKRIKIEHINAKLKNYKKIIIRYDKKTKNYLNTIYLFSILLNLG